MPSDSLWKNAKESKQEEAASDHATREMVSQELEAYGKDNVSDAGKASMTS
jgi:hypothetical protein